MIFLVQLFENEYAKLVNGEFDLLIRLLGQGEERFYPDKRFHKDDFLMLVDYDADSDPVIAKITALTPLYASLEELLDTPNVLRDCGMSGKPVCMAAEELKKTYFYSDEEICLCGGVYGVYFDIINKARQGDGHG